MVNIWTGLWINIYCYIGAKEGEYFSDNVGIKAAECFGDNINIGTKEGECFGDNIDNIGIKK